MCAACCWIFFLPFSWEIEKEPCIIDMKWAFDHYGMIWVCRGGDKTSKTKDDETKETVTEDETTKTTDDETNKSADDKTNGTAIDYEANRIATVDEANQTAIKYE